MNNKIIKDKNNKIIMELAIYINKKLHDNNKINYLTYKQAEKTLLTKLRT